MMTRKHFKVIAEELKWIKPKTSETDAFKQWEVTCMVMAHVCQQFNLSFNRTRFYEACGYED